MLEFDTSTATLKRINGFEQLKAPELLIIRTANQCLIDASKRPVPKMLFSEFWHEGELSILFADTNLGKSILAVQIADSISKGLIIPGFKLEAKVQPVLYFDFELSDKQFEKRYSEDYSNHFCFSENLYRIEINPDSTESNFEEQLFKSIEKQILEKGARVLIIDNITYLKAQSTETAKEALPLMKRLKELKLKYDLSILVLAHTPKRNLFNPITRNDISGSKHLANFVDSIFTIGESSENPSHRYLKQIKARATEIVYDSENVMICEIKKFSNFLGFHFIGFAREKEQLKEFTESDKLELENSIIEIHSVDPTLSYQQIADKIGTYKMKVARVLKKQNPN